jgi:hypothetical protein
MCHVLGGFLQFELNIVEYSSVLVICRMDATIAKLHLKRKRRADFAGAPFARALLQSVLRRNEYGGLCGRICVERREVGKYAIGKAFFG